MISTRFKFIVGFFAGLCSIFVPRLMLITMQGEVEGFPRPFIFAGIAFAFVIAGVVVIMEYNENKLPKDTFMMALGVPALLASVLNTSGPINQARELQAQNIMINQKLSKTLEIPIEAPLKLLELGSTLSNEELSSLNPFSPTLAYAGGAYSNRGMQQSTDHLDIRLPQTEYVVLIEKFSNKKAAINKANVIRTQFNIPTDVVKTQDNQFFVIDGSGIQSESNALLRAIQIKKKGGLTPSLLPIQK